MHVQPPFHLSVVFTTVTLCSIEFLQIESLREWAAQQTDLLEQNVPARLNAIEPTGYFDLTCQVSAFR